MGCSASKGNQIAPLPVEGINNLKAQIHFDTTDDTAKSSISKHNEVTLTEHDMNIENTKSNEISTDIKSDNRHPTFSEEEKQGVYQKPIAFAIPLTENQSSVPLKIFQRLEPLGVGKVTVESLAQKQKQAEDRKTNFIQRKSRKTSRLRNEVNAVREQTEKEIYNEVEQKINAKQTAREIARQPENDDHSYDTKYDDIMEVDETYNVAQHDEDDTI